MWCDHPPFGPTPTLNWNISLSNDVFGSPSDPAIMYVGQTYTSNISLNLLPKDTKFAGYLGPFETIRYSISVPSDPINITCGRVVAGDSRSLPSGPRVPNYNFNQTWCQPQGYEDNCGPQYVYDSSAVTYTFFVKDGGATLNFDSCESNFSTSIGVYRVSSASATQPVSWRDIVYPAVNRSMPLGREVVADSSDDDTVLSNATYLDAQLPHVGGCGLSQNAKTGNFTLSGPQLYAVVVQAGSIWGLSSLVGSPSTGRFVLKMGCTNSEQVLELPETRLGLRVDDITGTVSATPTTPTSNYSLILTATDPGPPIQKAVIKSWAVQVVSRRIFTRSALSFFYSPTFGSSAILAQNWTYTFRPPADAELPLATNPLFINGVGMPSYSVSYIGEPSGPDMNDDLLISPRSGLIQVIPRQVGRYSLRVVASDGTGTQTNVTESWEFEVRSPNEDWNIVLGPNGRGCGRGIQIESSSHDGAYTCDCSATDMVGDNCDVARPAASASSGSNTADLMQAVGGTLGLVFCTLLVAFAVARYRRFRRLQTPVDFTSDSIRNLAQSLGVGDTELSESHIPTELPRRNVRLLHTIGSGQFGTVQMALLQIRVSGNRVIELESAVKTLNDVSSTLHREDFLKEAVVTHQFNHPNVCAMHGVCTVGEPYLLVLELCSKGSLKKLLEEEDCELYCLHGFLYGIALGMEYLSSCGFVHRDLAARNVLVNAAYAPKVCDFGLSRSLEDKEYYKPGNDGELILPLRWTDPDIFDQVESDETLARFTEYTDVWAFGITATEIYGDAALPYLGWMDFYVLSQLRQGYRLPCPEQCPQEVYSGVIRPCWNPISKRPTFSELVVRMDHLSLVKDANKTPDRGRTERNVFHVDDTEEVNVKEVYSPQNRRQDAAFEVTNPVFSVTNTVENLAETGPYTQINKFEKSQPQTADSSYTAVRSMSRATKPPVPWHTEPIQRHNQIRHNGCDEITNGASARTLSGFNERGYDEKADGAHTIVVSTKQHRGHCEGSDETTDRAYTSVSSTNQLHGNTSGYLDVEPAVPFGTSQTVNNFYTDVRSGARKDFVKDAMTSLSGLDESEENV